MGGRRSCGEHDDGLRRVQAADGQAQRPGRRTGQKVRDLKFDLWFEFFG